MRGVGAPFPEEPIETIELSALPPPTPLEPLLVCLTCPLRGALALLFTDPALVLVEADETTDPVSCARLAEPERTRALCDCLLSG